MQLSPVSTFLKALALEILQKCTMDYQRIWLAGLYIREDAWIGELSLNLTGKP